jgi:hypothetical protein
MTAMGKVRIKHRPSTEPTNMDSKGNAAGTPEDWLKLENKIGAAEAIRRLGEEDLLFLNQLIVARLKLISQARSTAFMASFSPGDRVSFQSPTTGETLPGTVFRLNKKSATVQTDDGHRWNVYPGFLRKPQN